MGTRLAAADISTEQAVSYRVATHHLDDRLASGWLVEAAEPCALQDNAPAAAAVSLSARVDGLVPAEVERVVLVDRSLVRLASLRGVTHVIARRGGAAFAHGALAADESSLRDQLLGDWLTIEAAGWTARDALATVTGLLAAVLADGEPHTVQQLSAALHDRLPAELEPWCDRCRAHHVPDQLLRLAGTAGTYCYGRPQDGDDVLVSLTSWLSGELEGTADAARVELARRFLRAFAPAVPEHLAAWAGIGVEDARARFARLAFETVEVRFDGRAAWALEADRAQLTDPPPASGVRLLPPDDPFLQQRDRATLLPDAAARGRVWEADHRPGVVLVDGRPAATWSGRILDGCFGVTVEVLPGRRLPSRARLDVEDEVEMLAPFFGCDRVDVETVEP
jgi:winged helix DNA-binding protein